MKIIILKNMVIEIRLLFNKLIKFLLISGINKIQDDSKIARPILIHLSISYLFLAAHTANIERIDPTDAAL